MQIYLSKNESKRIRAWCKDNDIRVGDRGAVSGENIRKYVESRTYGIAEVIEAEFNTTYKDRIVTVICPFCPYTHKHGANLVDRGEIGGKSVHCGEQIVEGDHYVVVDNTEVETWEVKMLERFGS